jgi:membrane fusion protein (multidrug efflux system)
MVDTNTPVDAKMAAARASAALAHARVTTAEATLALTRLNLSYTTVTAPADGIVSRLMVREGQLVSPGQPLASVVPERTYVIANFKETQVGR